MGARFVLALALAAWAAAERPAAIQLEDRQRACGIGFVLDNGTTPDKAVIEAVLGGVALLDFDNDGRLDVFFTNGARIPGLRKDEPRFWNRLYRNQGDGTFADVTERAGVAGIGPAGKKLWSVGAAWLDYDNDGDLDLFVANYLGWSLENNKVCGAEGRRLSCSPTDYAGLPNLLYRNDGGGRFTDVSQATGIAAHVGKGMSVAVADADGDGFVDA